ncbi:MAG TPA: uroporphyrinogen-III synthase, partial [Bacillales bacterium]|nr:uroporphyrinogen-III synthase [Bacillales bacterium]
RLGADVTDLEVYKTVMDADSQVELVRLLEERRIDVVSFTSSSTVNHFFELLRGSRVKILLEEMVFACIGPVTAQTLESFGFSAHIVPDVYTIKGLVEAIENYYQEASR